MATGDAQRVWFLEMVGEFVVWWTPEVTWETLGEFCSKMMEMRKTIPEDRGIEAPLMYFPECDRMERTDVPGIAIRSALFSLKKAGASSGEQLQKPDRSWKRHQRKNGLDGCGKKKETQADGHESCANHAGHGKPQ